MATHYTLTITVILQFQKLNYTARKKVIRCPMVLSRANVYVGFEMFLMVYTSAINTSSNMQTVMLFIILFL